MKPELYDLSNTLKELEAAIDRLLRTCQVLEVVLWLTVFAAFAALGLLAVVVLK